MSASVSKHEAGRVVSIEMDGQKVDVAEIEVMDPPHEFTTRGLPDWKKIRDADITNIRKRGHLIADTETLKDAKIVCMRPFF